MIPSQLVASSTILVLLYNKTIDPSIMSLSFFILFSKNQHIIKKDTAEAVSFYSETALSVYCICCSFQRKRRMV